MNIENNNPIATYQGHLNQMNTTQNQNQISHNYVFCIQPREQEKIALPSIYYAHDREVFERDGMLLAAEFAPMVEGEESYTAKVRYRTLGDANITGAALSNADSIDKIVAEVAATRVTERGATRADDRISEAAMEDRKKEGYF